MELEVCRVPGIHDCFAALPLAVIEALQGSFDRLLFYITLELRPSHAKDTCYLAWAGGASKSSSIEVSDKLAECIGLPDRGQVHVKALADVAAASTVVLEPATEDDWEILELNAGFVEDHILSQVGVLCSGQLFPVWVQGQNVLTLKVISTSPKQVVRLVPGAELIVAPKPRKKFLKSQSETKPIITTTAVEPSAVKAWLRVQELNLSLAERCQLKDFSYYILPTAAIFVSPETAKNIPLNNGALVVVSSTDAQRAKRKTDSEKKQSLRVKAGIAGKADRDSRLIVLRLVYCNLVSEGHAMIASSVRLFIGAGIHTYIEVKGLIESPNLMQPLVILSPVEFETAERFANDANGNNHGQEEAIEGGFGLSVASEKTYENNSLEWEKYKELLTIISNLIDMEQRGDKDTVIDLLKPAHCCQNHKAKKLLKIWATAQIASISKAVPVECSSVPISREAIIQFLLFDESRKHLNLSTIFSVVKFSEEHSIENSTISSEKSAGALSFVLSLYDSNEEHKHMDVNSKEYATKDLMPYKGVFLLNLKLLEGEEQPGVKKEVGDVLGGINLGQPYHIPCSLESAVDRNKGPTLASLTWLKGPASEALSRLQILLSPEVQDKYHVFGLASPGYVLLHGPPACGKTKLALALARKLEEDPVVLAHKVFVKCAELGGEQVQAVRAALQDAVSKALRHAPSLVILDDLDVAIPSNSNSENTETSTTAAVLAEFLADLLDSFQAYRRNRCGGPIAFLALVRAVANLPASLCSSGRFDFHVALPAPATTERAAILHQELELRNFFCDQHIISEIASTCDGYDTADLEVVVDRAVHVAAARFLSLAKSDKPSMIDNLHGENGNQKAQDEMPQQTIMKMKNQKFELFKEDFAEALDGFLPVSMRDVAKSGGQIGRLGWEDVGGLGETCRALREMLELPVKYSKIFANAPLRLRSGVLLYGPPGCGKTHVVGATAAACSIRLISVKGPELLNKYIGASEQGVRDIFAKATAAAPCILFFDEFDAIAPKRGHDNTGVTDRVVNQLLTELDGVEALNGVFVFAATSRPDLLDAALLRPGRLDRLLLCDFPTAEERLEILKVLSRKLSLSEDVNLNVVASLTEHFSGADLQAVLSDAQLESVHRFLTQSKTKGASSGRSETIIITMDVLRSVLVKSRPSVSEGERWRLSNIYKEFMSSRSSIAGKARDTKGKRVTLA